MHVVVTGASGLIGSALTPALAGEGHVVERLVRGNSDGDPAAIEWDPATGVLDPARLEGVEAAVHLAGETLAGRWTTGKKRRIMGSRRDGTRLLAETLARLEQRPRVLVCASAVGYYGDGGERDLTERSPAGEGFLAEVVREWEAASEPAARAGIRVVNLRFGIVLSAQGGALQRMLVPFRLGLGGPFGNGRQWMSWIALDDVVGAIRHALTKEDLSGPANATSPEPVRNRDFARTLGRVLGRPAVLPAPSLVLRLALGEFAREGLLYGQRALPVRLRESGYTFRFPELEGALRHLLGK